MAVSDCVPCKNGQHHRHVTTITITCTCSGDCHIRLQERNGKMTVTDQEKLEHDIANAKALLEANGFVVTTKHPELLDLGLMGMAFIASKEERHTDEKVALLRKMYAKEISHVKDCAHCQAVLEDLNESLLGDILH